MGVTTAHLIKIYKIKNTPLAWMAETSVEELVKSCGTAAREGHMLPLRRLISFAQASLIY